MAVWYRRVWSYRTSIVVSIAVATNGYISMHGVRICSRYIPYEYAADLLYLNFVFFSLSLSNVCAKWKASKRIKPILVVTLAQCYSIHRNILLPFRFRRWIFCYFIYIIIFSMALFISVCAMCIDVYCIHKPLFAFMAICVHMFNVHHDRHAIGKAQ